MDELDVLKSAINLEEEGIRFYRGKADQIENQYASLFFKRMVGEENDHRETLSKALESLEKKQPPEIDVDSLPDIDVFPKQGRGEETPGEGYVEALNFALEIEEKSMQLYRKARDNTKYPSLKGLYDYLVDFEKKHFDRIKGELDYIENTAGSSELG